MIRYALTAFAMLAAPTTAHAGDLRGKVSDAAASPVAGARVMIAELGLATITDADGTYRFEGLDAGNYRIAVQLADDARQHVSVKVLDTGEATRNIFLYSGAALDHARSGMNPVEAMLAEALMAQAWEAASEMTAQADAQNARTAPEFPG
ncbi:MAG: carboxypeptidase-like regulatory domain-containing protein [Alteraurantiacibacter sp.]